MTLPSDYSPIQQLFGNDKKGGFFDLPKEPKQCKSPNHAPPQHIYIPQGKGYRHICPVCGAETTLIPPQISF